MPLMWTDGQVVPDRDAGIRWDDPALREGFGLFETIRIAGGRAFLAGCHAQRITAASSRLGIEPWLHPRTITRGIDRLVLASGYREGVVRLYLLPSGISPAPGGRLEPGRATSKARYVAVISETLPEVPAFSHAVLAPDLRDSRGPLVGLKTLSRAAEILSLAQARRGGADEVLYRNLFGRITEGTRSNVFVIEGERLITPPLAEGLLAGVTRWFLMTLAKDVGLVPREEPLTVERLLKAEEAFLTSTLRGVVALLSLDAQPIGSGAEGARSKTLRRVLETHMTRS